MRADRRHISDLGNVFKLFDGGKAAYRCGYGRIAQDETIGSLRERNVIFFCQKL